MLGVHLSHGPQLQLVRTRAESDDIVPHKSPERNVHVHIIIMNRTVKKSEKFSHILVDLLCRKLCLDGCSVTPTH